jgi:hypothetical protein
VANFIRRLKRESRISLFCQYLSALCLGFLSWSGLLVLLDLYDAYSPIQEKEISLWVIGVLILSLLSFVSLFIRTWLKRPSSKKLAQQIESAHPELRDLLNAAVEIEGKKENLGLMERRVLRQLDKQAYLMDWGKDLRPSSSLVNFLVLGFVAGIILSFWSFNRSPLTKARAVLSGEEGLLVWSIPSGSTMGKLFSAEWEYRRGTDVSILADIIRGHRGKKEASVEWQEGNGTVTLEMIQTEVPGRFELVLPSLQEKISYRVITPSLQSKWYELSPYDPPELEFARWEITPPAYLKMEPFSHDGFGYLEAPENSHLLKKLVKLPFPGWGNYQINARAVWDSQI